MKTTTLTISNPISDSLLRCALILIPFVLICVATLPGAHAVSPAPDGGYPGFNTAEGQNALFSLTTGAANTAVGFRSLFSETEGSFNTATGAGALLFNTAGENTAFGAAALLFNTTGMLNTAVGAAALSNNTLGQFNTADGHRALNLNITGDGNTAVGESALLSNTAGESNTAIGLDALANNTTGARNVALGVDAGLNVTTASNVICIGLNVFGANVSDTCFIGNIRGVTTQNANAIPVLIDPDGQLGTMSSSRRFKDDIKPMDKASEAVLALKPVTFHYKSDKTNRPEFGLIAEDVAAVNHDLVVRDENGDIYTVRYEAVNVMLLNEFLKEHRKLEEQGATITQQRKDFEAALARQQKQIEALTAGLQKVSAQLEVSKPAPQTAQNTD
jgi:Chaperone of endosialidase